MPYGSFDGKIIDNSYFLIIGGITKTLIFYLFKGLKAPHIPILEPPFGRFREAFPHLFNAIGPFDKSADSSNYGISQIMAAGPLAVLVCGFVFLQTQSACQAYTIEGKVEHVERLPAVDQKFTPGVQFDQNIELSPNNFWVKIPNWLAGSWSAREETAVLFQDFRSGRSRNQQETFKAKQDFTYGQQIDRSGQIWHYVGVPYTSKTVHTNAEEIHEVKEKQFLKANDDEVEFRAVATVMLIDNISSRIQRTYQQESLTDYQPISSDRMSMSASTKVFDSAGRPQTLQKNEAIIKRYKHFQKINEKDGKDLKALFREFMIAKGMGELLADEK